MFNADVARVCARLPFKNKGFSLVTETKFGAGQRVSVQGARWLSLAPAGAYHVVAALPVERGAQQYRVRHEGESFDRVIDEARLEAASND